MSEQHAYRPDCDCLTCAGITEATTRPPAPAPRPRRAKRDRTPQGAARMRIDPDEKGHP